MESTVRWLSIFDYEDKYNLVILQFSIIIESLIPFTVDNFLLVLE